MTSSFPNEIATLDYLVSFRPVKIRVSAKRETIIGFLRLELKGRKPIQPTMRVLQSLLFASLWIVCTAAATHPEPNKHDRNDPHVRVRTSPRSLASRSLFNVFNLQSLFHDTSKSVQVNDDNSPQPGRTYFNLFTSIFGESPTTENVPPPEITRIETRAPTTSPTLNPTAQVSEAVAPTSMPVTAAEVAEAAMGFISVFPDNWKPKPQGSYSSIFLSIFAPRPPPPPTVSPAPTVSAAPSSVPSSPPSLSPTVITELPSASPTALTGVPSLVPTSQMQTALPSEVASQAPSVEPGNPTASPTTESPSQFPSVTPTSDTTSDESDPPSLVPSSAESDSTVAPSVLTTSEDSSNLPSTLPTAGGTSAPTTTQIQGEFVTTLNLDEVPENYRQVFIGAAARWDTVIVGDLEDFVPSANDRTNAGTRCNVDTIPDVIDDVFICASLPEIDGPVGILGTAGPLVARLGGGTVQTSIGYMQFDIADVEILNGNGQLNGLIVSTPCIV